VLEDSADTIAAEIEGGSSGRFTDMSTTSFYGSHIMNCGGNGGMLCVNSEEYYNRGKLLRSWGRSSSLFVESEKIENRFNVEIDGIPYDAKFVFEEPGYNIEPSEMGAAFGLVQFSKLPMNIDLRTAHYIRLRKFFEQYEEYFILPNQLPNSRTGWLAFAVTIRETAPFIRRDLQIFLEKRNIQTRTVFTGNILRQPGFKNCAHKASKDGYFESDKVMRGGMLMACHHGLNEIQINHMMDSINEFMKEI
jgi:CDP-6-deoxy-D-xylo-4-hexulose-3-dehydrase